MKTSLSLQLEALIGQAYRNAVNTHGDLLLSEARFAERVLRAIDKLQAAGFSESSPADVFKRLHTGDLYLASACAEMRPSAWERFISLFTPVIEAAARYACRSSALAADLAATIPGRLCSLDASERCRIASYDGSQPLEVWLRAVVVHRAIADYRLKNNQTEPLEHAAALADELSVERIEAAIRANRYGPLIRDSFRAAGKTLAESERYILQLRYEHGLNGREIARLLGVHASRVTRKLQAVQCKLRESVHAALVQQGLDAAGIAECMTEIRDNPEYSILACLEGGGGRKR